MKHLVKKTMRYCHFYFQLICSSQFEDNLEYLNITIFCICQIKKFFSSCECTQHQLVDILSILTNEIT